MNTAVVELFDGVDDLIRRVADTENPEIRKVRARVHAALVVARNAFEVESKPVPSPAAVEPVMAAHGAMEVTEDWVSPYYSAKTLGVALLVGLGLGLMFKQ